MSFRALLADDRFIRFYDHWLALRRGRPMPARRDLDPADIKDLLPNIVITQAAGERFLYRLVGTQIVERMGSNYAGRHLDELAARDGLRDFMTEVYATVRDGRRAVLSETDYADPRGAKRIRRLAVPFSENSAEVNHIVSLVLFFWPAWAASLIVSDDSRPQRHQIAAIDDPRP